MNDWIIQSCLTLCDPRDSRLLYPWNFPGRNTGADRHSLLQGTQGLNLSLLHCRQILYHLSHQGSPVLWIRTHKHTAIKMMNFLQGRTMLMTWIWYSEEIRFNWIDAYQALAYARYCFSHHNIVVKKKKSQCLWALYFSKFKYGII